MFVTYSWARWTRLGIFCLCYGALSARAWLLFLGLGFDCVLWEDSVTAGVPVRIMGNFFIWSLGRNGIRLGPGLGGDYHSHLLAKRFGTSTSRLNNEGLSRRRAKGCLALLSWGLKGICLRRTRMRRIGGVFCCNYTIFYTGLGTRNTEMIIFTLTLFYLVSS